MAVKCPGVGARRDALTAYWALAAGGLPEAPRAEPRGRPSGHGAPRWAARSEQACARSAAKDASAVQRRISACLAPAGADRAAQNEQSLFRRRQAPVPSPTRDAILPGRDPRPVPLAPPLRRSRPGFSRLGDAQHIQGSFRVRREVHVIQKREQAFPVAVRSARTKASGPAVVLRVHWKGAQACLNCSANCCASVRLLLGSAQAASSARHLAAASGRGARRTGKALAQATPQ